MLDNLFDVFFKRKRIDDIKETQTSKPIDFNKNNKNDDWVDLKNPAVVACAVYIFTLYTDSWKVFTANDIVKAIIANPVGISGKKFTDEELASAMTELVRHGYLLCGRVLSPFKKENGEMEEYSSLIIPQEKLNSLIHEILKNDLIEFGYSTITEGSLEYKAKKLFTYERLKLLLGDKLEETAWHEICMLSIFSLSKFNFSEQTEKMLRNIVANAVAGKFYSDRNLKQNKKLEVFRLMQHDLVSGIVANIDGVDQILFYPCLYVDPMIQMFDEPEEKVLLGWNRFSWGKIYPYMDVLESVNHMLDKIRFSSINKSGDITDICTMPKDLYSKKDTDIAYIKENQAELKKIFQIDDSFDDSSEIGHFMNSLKPEEKVNAYATTVLEALYQTLDDDLQLGPDVDVRELIENFSDTYLDLNKMDDDDHDVQQNMRAINANDEDITSETDGTNKIDSSSNLTVKERESLKEFVDKYPVPKIMDYLDQYIAGQRAAKKAAAILLYKKALQLLVLSDELSKNTKNLNKDNVSTDSGMDYDNGNVSFEGSNLLVVGPTGCGKTYIWMTLRRISPIPIFITDVSGVTRAGYKGEDISIIFSGLKEEVRKGTSKSMLEASFIVLDEFDKICSRESKSDDFNRCTQGQMLSLVEGAYVKCGKYKCNTKNMEFIFLGAFEDVYAGKDDENKKEIGFKACLPKNEDIKDNLSLTINDIMKYGLRAELAGRIGNFVTMETLSEDDMKSIIRIIPSNLIKSAKEKYVKLGIDVEISDEAADHIAHMAYKKKLGARTMKKMLDNLIDEVAFMGDQKEKVYISTKDVEVIAE